jgi:DNA (cytosine-5)-methyltransferase 1
MKVVGLFSGIGGFELGLSRAGHETLLTSETLPTAQAVLATRLSGHDMRGDIREIKDLPGNVDAIVGGFPCQDLSQAGTTQGLAGSRSGLVGEIFRLAARSKVPWIVLENVPFMLQLRGGAAMRTIVGALEDLGYLWAWRVVDTYGFGLPQRRERVFLIASRVDDPADVIFADEAEVERPRTAIGRLAHGFYWTEGRGGLGWAVDAVPTLKNGSAVGIPSPPAILLPDGAVVTPDIRDAERLQGFTEDWTLPALEMTRRAGARWSLVGNAVSVPVVEWLGKRLTCPGIHDRYRDGPFPDSGSLPRAARFDGTRRYRVDIGADPIGLRPQSLVAFLMHAGAPLSMRATSGFLSRTRTATLRFAPGFIPAIESHLAGIVARDAPRAR